MVQPKTTGQEVEVGKYGGRSLEIVLSSCLKWKTKTGLLHKRNDVVAANVASPGAVCEISQDGQEHSKCIYVINVVRTYGRIHVISGRCPIR